MIVLLGQSFQHNGLAFAYAGNGLVIMVLLGRSWENVWSMHVLSSGTVGNIDFLFESGQIWRISGLLAGYL